MPLILIKTSASEISSVISKETQEQAENALSVILNKSRDYVMSILEYDHRISFAGDSTAPSAYIEVKNVGVLLPEITESLCGEITAIVTSKLDIKQERIYIEFQQSERHLWAWNGRTFA